MSDDSILAELRPCGYVLATSQYKYFALKCLYCEKKYAYWATFLQHLKRLHNRIANEDPWLPECSEVTLEPQVEFDEASDEVECLNEIMETNDLDLDSHVSQPDGDVNEIELLYESPEEENGSTKNMENYLRAHTVIVNTTITKDNCQEYIDNSHDDLNNESHDIVSSVPKLSQLHINLGEKDEMTDQFIEAYKNFPILWSTEQICSEVDDRKSMAKTQLQKSLAKQNLFITMSTLEDAILQIYQQYFDITRRLEEGIEISNTEEKYFATCSFLMPYGKIELERRQILDETGSEASLGELHCIDKDSQSAFDLSDDEIEVLQNNWQRKQTILKFSTRNKITCDFMHCFRNHSCLWNTKDPAYNDPKERIQAFDKIKKFFLDNHSLQLTEGKINSDIKRLNNFYKRCISSHRTLNTTRKYYFELCDFLAHTELNNYSQRSDIHQKISFSTTDELTRGFIDFCAMHPVLWDKNHPNYSVFNSRKEAYDEIALNLQQLYNVEFSNEDLYYAISRLKHHYYSLQRKQKQQESLTKDEQDLLDRCNFLPKSKNNLKCHICQRILRSQCTLQTHLLKAHNIGELPHKCDYCEQRFAQRNSKKEHEIRAHTKEFDWFCPFCAKGFVNRHDMEMHQMVHTGERKIICEHCGKRFRLKNQMTEHVKIVHERLRRFKCTMCPKDFLRKRQLDDHIRAHLNIRDKICNICGKGFTNFHGLFRHKQLHSIKRYECNECGRCFHRFSGLRSHKKLKHQMAKPPENSMNVLMEEEEENHQEQEENEIFVRLNALNNADMK